MRAIECIIPETPPSASLPLTRHFAIQDRRTSQISITSARALTLASIELFVELDRSVSLILALLECERVISDIVGLFDAVRDPE
jgi:hypothetical protein